MVGRGLADLVVASDRREPQPSGGPGLLTSERKGARTVAVPEVLLPEQSPQFPRQSANGPRNEWNPTTMGASPLALIFRIIDAQRHQTSPPFRDHPHKGQGGSAMPSDQIFQPLGQPPFGRPRGSFRPHQAITESWCSIRLAGRDAQGISARLGHVATQSADSKIFLIDRETATSVDMGVPTFSSLSSS